MPGLDFQRGLVVSPRPATPEVDFGGSCADTGDVSEWKSAYARSPAFKWTPGAPRPAGWWVYLAR